MRPMLPEPLPPHIHIYNPIFFWPSPASPPAVSLAPLAAPLALFPASPAVSDAFPATSPAVSCYVPHCQRTSITITDPPPSIIRQIALTPLFTVPCAFSFAPPADSAPGFPVSFPPPLSPAEMVCPALAAAPPRPPTAPLTVLPRPEPRVPTYSIIYVLVFAVFADEGGE